MPSRLRPHVKMIQTSRHARHIKGANKRQMYVNNLKTKKAHLQTRSRQRKGIGFFGVVARWPWGLLNQGRWAERFLVTKIQLNRVFCLTAAKFVGTMGMPLATKADTSARLETGKLFHTFYSLSSPCCFPRILKNRHGALRVDVEANCLLLKEIFRIIWLSEREAKK